MRSIWAVPLRGFKIDAYLVMYHACHICLRKAPIVAVSHSRLIRAVSLFVLKNEAFPTYTAFNCVLSLKKSEVYFPLSALEMNCFTSWLREWAILHVYCICWRTAPFCLKARKAGCHSPLKRAVSPQGEERGISRVCCTCHIMIFSSIVIHFGLFRSFFNTLLNTSASICRLLDNVKNTMFPIIFVFISKLSC